MKRITLLLLLFLFVLFPVFMSARGEVSVTKKLSVIKTEYFDIIFPEESEPTAKHLAQQADDIYRKATAFLNIESTLRLPVVVTPETDILNAYFVADAYIRIVIYDTLPFEEIAVFSDSLASVLYHEVIHALSLTIKSPFWDAITPFFGDILSPFMILNMPISFSEGTAVLAESLNGEGRLNHAYSVHAIKQAKIEGKFPDWRDIAGAYQLYTDASLPYIFGGAFSNYLYQTYGMEKFSDFWNQCSTFNFTFYEGVFEKVYPLSLDDAWQDFEDSIYISPLALPAQALFSQETLSRTANGQLYQHLTASPDGIAWQDGFSGTVRFLPYSLEDKKISTLYTTDLKTRLHFSRDGRYLVSSGFTGGLKSQSIVHVYDLERRANILIQKDLREAAVLTIPKDADIALDSPLKGVSTLLVGVQADASLASLVLYDMDSLQSASNSEPLISIPFERNIFLFEPLDIGNGMIVALMQNAGTWQFFVYDCITRTQRAYTVDEQFLKPSGIRDISASDTRLYMSYAQDVSSQPVLAYINLDDFSGDALTLHMQTEQVSGGVFDPVVISSTAQDIQTEEGQVNIAYLSKYYENRALSVMPLESTDSFETLTFTAYSIPDTTVALIDYPIEPYKPSEYMKKGLFIPLIGSVNLTPFTDFLPQNLSVGATAFTLDPAGRFLIVGGAGYDWTGKQFTATLSTVFSENYFTATTDVFAAFSLVNLKTFATKLYTNFTIPLGSNFDTIRFANALNLFYLAEPNENLLEGHTLYNITEISFRHLRPTGQFFYDRIGFNFGTQIAVRKHFDQKKLKPSIVEVLFLGLYVPQLLPFQNPDRFALNLPTTVTGYRYFNSSAIWKIKSTVVIFAYDVQKPISFVPFFVQRLTLDAGLDCMWYEFIEPQMTLHGSLFVTFSLNTGFATKVPVDLGVAFTWEPHISGKDGLDIKLKFALNL